jgi:hypothetical protein
MNTREHKFKLIGNRFSAILAVCLMGFLAQRDIRGVFSETPHESGWLMPLDFLRLPGWGVAVINLAFYIYLIWVGVWFYRRTEGNERLLVAGFLTSGLLGLFGRIRALASPHPMATIRSLQSVCMTVAFVAAILILLKSPAFGRGDAKTALRLSGFLGAFVVVALLLGALIYFLY